MNLKYLKNKNILCTLCILWLKQVRVLRGSLCPSWFPRVFCGVMFLWLGSSVSFGELKVATLHPLLTDLAENVGKEHVEVVSLLKAGGDPHTFSPSPGDMVRIRDAKIILASGKSLETYLDKLASNLAPGQEIFEVGKKIPSIRIEVGELFVCCPAHNQGGLDPHWWHSIANMQRAARYVGDEFARLDPENASAYRENARAYQKQLDGLKQWATKTLSAIPRADRELVTAHAAFGYFCKEFGFRSIPVQGLDRESDPSPSYLSETIRILKAENAKAVFPEKLANPKILQSMVHETGIKLAPPLIADGTSGSFEEMIRHNVSTIANALQ